MDISTFSSKIFRLAADKTPIISVRGKKYLIDSITDNIILVSGKTRSDIGKIKLTELYDAFRNGDINTTQIRKHVSTGRVYSEATAIIRNII